MTKTRETTLIIPRVAPSFNDLRDMHWAEYRNLAQTWREEITLAFRQEGSPSFSEPVEIAYVRSYYNGYSLDWDNLGGSAKPVIDALLPPRDSQGTMLDVDAPLSDDDPSVIESLEFNQVRLAKEEHPVTRVIIRD